jgi:isochorismate hydrolase
VLHGVATPLIMPACLPACLPPVFSLTSGCVRATALDALQSGFAPFVVRDACGDRHSAPHDANLFDLQAKYAEVVSEGEAIEFLRSSALSSPET